MNELYSKEILRLAAEAPVVGRLERPDATVTKTSRTCGSRITVDVCVANGVIHAYGHEVKACALGQGSSVIVARNVLGVSSDEIKAVMAGVEKFLAGQGEGPTGKWSAYKVFAPARMYASRHPAILLPLVALASAFEICCRDPKA